MTNMDIEDAMIAILNIIIFAVGVWVLAELSKITGPWALITFILIIAVLGIVDGAWLYLKFYGSDSLVKS